MTSQDRWLLWQCTIMEKIIQLLQCPPHLNPLSFSIHSTCLTFSHCALKLPCTIDSNVESYFMFLTLLPSLILWLKVPRDDSDSRDWGVAQNRRLFPPCQTWRAPCSAAASHVHGRHLIPT